MKERLQLLESLIVAIHERAVTVETWPRNDDWRVYCSVCGQTWIGLGAPSRRHPVTIPANPDDGPERISDCPLMRARAMFPPDAPPKFAVGDWVRATAALQDRVRASVDAGGGGIDARLVRLCWNNRMQVLEVGTYGAYSLETPAGSVGAREDEIERAD